MNEKPRPLPVPQRPEPKRPPNVSTPDDPDAGMLEEPMNNPDAKERADERLHDDVLLG